VTLTVATPYELFGPLFEAVQERAILPDGKTFVDAVPRRPVGEIMSRFEQLASGDEALRDFVADHFDLPPAANAVRRAEPGMPLRAYIRALWPELAREPVAASGESSALPVPHRHIVPGGRFREVYYWDSFFTMLGLMRDGEGPLANEVVEALTGLIEDHGHIPNGARTYFLGRSQPPVFHLMVELLADARPEVAQRRLAAMKREHAWWMDGADVIGPGERHRHVARLSDGTLVNRYWDSRALPREESWREDVATAAASGRVPEEVYRDLRAGAESGWDFSSRWLRGRELSSIRTTAIAPVDLNALLYGLETAIAAGSSGEEARRYRELAGARRAALQGHFWNAEAGLFADVDLDEEAISPVLSAAALTPLLVGAASEDQADATAETVQRDWLAPGGLRTTLVDSGEQWDRPNGWAPLQWMAVTGLRRYGHHALALDIARRWIATVETAYRNTGLIYEKYDIEQATVGAGGEYAAQTGFGWTNGVTADFMNSMESWRSEATAAVGQPA